MVDVTEVKGEVQIGDEAVLIGSQGNEVITASEVGLQADTNYAEILMKVSLRVRRLYYVREKLVEVKSII
jgi:alanine racemase